MTSLTNLGLKSIFKAYRNGENVLELIRNRFGLETNHDAAILIAYDAQAGSYVEALANPEYAAVHRSYSYAVASVLNALGPTSLLDAGVGEATTLASVLEYFSPAVTTYGFDCSLSRVLCGREHLERTGQRAELVVGELQAVPFTSNSFHTVVTCHAIEPNHGRETEILLELYRVCSRYLVLFEPGYEFANDEQRARMESLGYCRGLADIALKHGLKIQEHRPFEVSINVRNPTGLLIIEKTPATDQESLRCFACPGCGENLSLKVGHYCCSSEGLVFPVIAGVPCLTRGSAILASRLANTPASEHQSSGPHVNER